MTVVMSEELQGHDQRGFEAGVVKPVGGNDLLKDLPSLCHGEVMEAGKPFVAVVAEVDRCL